MPIASRSRAGRLVAFVDASLSRKGLLRHIGLSNVTATQIAEGRQICDIVEGPVSAEVVATELAKRGRP